ncbi:MULTISPECIES: hypothetical protein [Mycolicibacter]|uniref:Uncharacterized protein n=2 Tax=Mycolicibacter TaxID=1073531 RepID=A0ABU5XLF3_9MYCO|nr:MULTISPECIES: hypothetical protein [unclassified Mycolicibacter]MEB3023026.1 hypothetical protein [Mycolicibacter sp. MYC098]MEB3033536.1 hypothetical protein [Mycolicibacter sp. MYC340]
MSLALSAGVGGLVSGWSFLLGRLKDRDLAGRIAHASFVFSTVAMISLAAILTGAQGPRLYMALIALPMAVFVAVAVFARSA